MGIPGYVTLGYPQALVLGLLIAYLYYRFLRNKNVWRGAMLVLAILLLAWPALVRINRSFDIYLLVDRSRSISDEARSKQSEILDLVARNLRQGDRIGIVSFNEKAYIEQPPQSQIVKKSFDTPYSEDASDLADGLQTILNVVKNEGTAKIFVLSDGQYTGRTPVPEAQIARQRNIPIFYRDLPTATFFNLAVKDIETPEKLLTNEPFRVAFRVHSSVNTPGRYRLYRDGRIIATGEGAEWRPYDFKTGENLILFTDNLKNAGIHSYKLEVEPIPKESESLRNDNIAEKYVQAVGERPLLVVNNTGQPDNITRILSAGGLQSHIANISNFRLTINQFEGYKGIILNNVPITGLTYQQINGLQKFVLEEGGGLLVTGGNRSFALGGYYRTSLEPILPVSLEDRKQSKKVRTAISIVLDRSGSMSMSTPSGQQKMDLANHAAAESLGLLTSLDSISVIAVDSAAHIIVPQQPAEDVPAISSQIRSIESMGGGIFCYTGLVAAGSELAKSDDVLNKHIILFADAADAEEPGDYIKLLEDYKEAGITVSVVGLGNETDVDAEFLKDIARRGGGQVYFTQDAEQLVQFFTADTISYSRKSFVEEPAPMSIKPASLTMAPRHSWEDFTASGYNLMFSKPKADVAILTADSDAAPVLAFWQRGLGRVAALALDTNGSFASQQNYGDIMLSLARWIMGSNVADNLQITVDYEGNYARVSMEVSQQERQTMGAAKVSIFTPKGQTVAKSMNWEGPNRLSATYKLSDIGLYRGVIQVGNQAYKIGPMSIPVSPEFLQDRGRDFGRDTLSQMASLSGGKKILDVRDLFKRTDFTTVVRPVIFPFLVLFLMLFILDIAEARFGIQHMLARRFALIGSQVRGRYINIRQTVSRKEKQPAPESRGQRYNVPKSVRQMPDREISQKPSEQPAASTPSKQPDDMDYLSQSKARASRRFGQRP